MRIVLIVAVLALSAACVSSELLRSVQNDLARISQSQAAADTGLEQRLANYAAEIGEQAEQLEALEDAADETLGYVDLLGGGGALALVMNYLRDRKYVNKAKASEVGTTTTV